MPDSRRFTSQTFAAQVLYGDYEQKHGDGANPAPKQPAGARNASATLLTGAGLEDNRSPQSHFGRSAAMESPSPDNRSSPSDQDEASKVWLCKRPANVMKGLVDHWWLKTEKKEAGLGAADRGVAGE